MSNIADNAPTREQWLLEASDALQILFTEVNELLPPYRVSCGWPSRNALSRNGRALGEAWQGIASGDGTSEVFISPYIDDSLEVLGILCHELCHVATPGCGHRKEFSSLGRSIGLDGKPTQMLPNDMLNERLNIEFLSKLGQYPHSKLDGTAKSKKQSTRMLKAECKTTTYVVRLTKKWLDQYGPPLCPCCREIMEIGD